MRIPQLALTLFISLGGLVSAVHVTMAAANGVEQKTVDGITNSAEEAAPAEESEEEQVLRHFDLGIFQISQFRPTRNETIIVLFEAHLVLSNDADETLEKTLEFWKHRLREQVVTSVRLSETKDFSEPELFRLRRVIQLRINRIIPVVWIEGVYMPRFVFGLK